jgi:hypothetical protein
MELEDKEELTSEVPDSEPNKQNVSSDFLQCRQRLTVLF